ncbi:MAG: hypothetical protein OXI60_11060 [Acidiferrobacterales bacterium]|nr:hypothetical protein [Acidiferrobacterales bacterium]
MDCKGLIFALGRQSQASLPITVTGNRTESADDIPRVCFTIEVMASAGIRKILIGATPENLIRHREAVRQYADLKAELSYLVLDEDAGVSRGLLSASEFASRSSLMIADAGLYCEGRGLSSRLATVLHHCKGVTAFRMRGCLSMEGELVPRMLVLDARVRDKLRAQDADQLTEISALRKFCAINFGYTECDFEDSSHFVDLNDCSEVDESIVANALAEIRPAPSS